MNFRRLSKKIININNDNNDNDNDNYNDNNTLYNNYINEENEYNLLRKNKISNINKNIELTTIDYRFILKYEKMMSNNEYFTIYNDKGEYCIRIKKDYEEVDDIYLQKLNFFETCSKNKSLMKKKGTLEMLLCSLQYVRDFYKKDLNYIFQDDSSIIILGNKIMLNIAYILLYGETWYMKYINAQPYFGTFSKDLQKFNEYLLNNKDNLYRFFDDKINNINENFIENMNNKYNNILDLIIPDKIISSNEKINKKQIWINIIKCYKSSVNSRDFLLSLYKNYGMSIFLLINYYDYFSYVKLKLKINLDINTYMIIPNIFINNIDIIQI